MYSFGENIRIDLREHQPGRTHLPIRCGPTLGTTLVDYGVNLRNLDVLISRLIEYTDGPRTTPATDGVQVEPEARRGQVRQPGSS